MHSLMERGFVLATYELFKKLTFLNLSYRRKDQKDPVQQIRVLNPDKRQVRTRAKIPCSQPAAGSDFSAVAG